MVIDTSVRDAWDVLRGARSAPPGLAATTPRRRRVFGASLEQAEQFFRAAATVGPATQPVLVFYGLSQAGRAIAASATALVQDDRWGLSGHGIRAKQADGPLTEVRALTDAAGKRASFVRLSELLDSPVWEDEPVTLAELWDCLPVNVRTPLDPGHSTRVTPLLVDHHSVHNEPHPLVSVPVVACDVRPPPGVARVSDQRRRGPRDHQESG
ncbi:hypothetical protein ATKI12_8780 [Kitasatospora sp. Ki12]